MEISLTKKKRTMMKSTRYSSACAGWKLVMFWQHNVYACCWFTIVVYAIINLYFNVVKSYACLLHTKTSRRGVHVSLHLFVRWFTTVLHGYVNETEEIQARERKRGIETEQRQIKTPILIYAIIMLGLWIGIDYGTACAAFAVSSAQATHQQNKNKKIKHRFFGSE